MLNKTIIGFMLALFAGPLSAHAEMPGQPCQKEQIGTTKMADDKQNIIACLETGKVAPENIQEWKSMSSGGGRGITGGCMLGVSGAYVDSQEKRYVPRHLYVKESWGMGCSRRNELRVPVPSSGTHACNSLADQGYVCGMVYWVQYQNSTQDVPSCICVEK